MVAELEAATSLSPVPAFIWSDNGHEFIAQALRGWCGASGNITAYIGTPEKASRWLDLNAANEQRVGGSHAQLFNDS